MGCAVAAVLDNPAKFAGQGCDLTGPEYLGFSDIKKAMTRELKRPVLYRHVSVPSFVVSQIRDGRSVSMALGMSALYPVQRFGKAADISPDFEWITHERPGDATLLVVVATIAGAIAQFPVGLPSDHMDRRFVVVGLSVVCTVTSVAFAIGLFDNFVLVAAALLGASVLPVYSLCVAYTNDLARL